MWNNNFGSNYSHNCFVCEKKFKSSSKYARYCSNDCKRIGNYQKNICFICEKEFLGKKDTKTCSRECQTKMRKDSNLIELECFNCLNTFERSKNYISDIEGKHFCSRRCNNSYYIYENISNKKYSENWEKTRQKIFSIYGEQCISCESEQRIEVHHCIPKRFFIENPRLSDNIEYLIPLCFNCHKKAHKENDKWFSANFTNIETLLTEKRYSLNI